MGTKWVKRNDKFHYKILQQNGLDDEGEKFLKNLFLSYIQKNIDYHKKTNDWFFYYGEIQNTSAVYPALAKICKEVFIECPVQRKYRGIEPKKGERIDYWAWYKKDIEVILEKKLTYLSINGTSDCPAYLSESIIRLKKQLKSISKKTIWDTIVYGDCKTVYKIGLQMVYLYGESKDKEKLTKDRDDLEHVGKRLLEGLAKDWAPNWSAIWLNDEEPFHYPEDGKYYVYPGAIWLVYFETLKREKR